MGIIRIGHAYFDWNIHFLDIHAQFRSLYRTPGMVAGYILGQSSTSRLDVEECVTLPWSLDAKIHVMSTWGSWCGIRPTHLVLELSLDRQSLPAALTIDGTIIKRTISIQGAAVGFEVYSIPCWFSLSCLARTGIYKTTWRWPHQGKFTTTASAINLRFASATWLEIRVGATVYSPFKLAIAPVRAALKSEAIDLWTSARSAAIQTCLDYTMTYLVRRGNRNPTTNGMFTSVSLFWPSLRTMASSEPCLKKIK